MQTEYPLTFDASAKIIAEAAALVPGGVNSAFRIGMQGGPLVFERGEGPYLFDVDGNKLIDYYCGMGAMVLGHSPKGVQEAVKAQVEQGILYAGQSRLEFEAARLLNERVPSAERIRFGSSGSEVAQAAWRLARAATGRDKIIKFEGHYHGWFDNVLWSTAPSANAAGPSDSPAHVAGSNGMEHGSGDHLIVLQWNDLEVLEAALKGGEVAAVMMEAAMCNQGAISPKEGYLEGAKALCQKYGAVLIFDEVITGFRLGQGGAQKRFGVTPDLSIFAKAMANGFHVAALVGKADLMDLFATGGVLHGGTFNSQPVTMAAMIATQEGLTEAHYQNAGAEGLRLREGLKQIFAEEGVKAQVTGFELMFHVAFGLDAPAQNYRDLLRRDHAGYVAFAHEMLKRGVRVLERGAWFVSSEHKGVVIDDTLEVARAAVRAVKGQLS